MRYMAFVKMSEDGGSRLAALVEAMGKEMGEAFAAGRMVDAGGRVPAGAEHRDPGHRREHHRHRRSLRRGQGGHRRLSILELQSQHEAIAAARRVAELHREHWPEWEGSVEVRQIAGPDEGPASQVDQPRRRALRSGRGERRRVRSQRRLAPRVRAPRRRAHADDQ